MRTLLRNRFPELYSYIDFEKNIENGFSREKLESLSCGCHDEIWFKCKNGHSYKKIVHDMTSRKNPCKLCGILDSNNNIMKYPDIYNRIDFEKCENELNVSKKQIDLLSITSFKKLWFKCKCGNSKFSNIYNFNTYPRCGSCYRKDQYEKYLINLKESELFVNLYPELYKQIDFEKCNKELGLTRMRINMFPKNNTIKIFWKCDYNHTWKTSMASRVGSNKTSKCPFCSRKISTIEVRIWSEIISYYPDVLLNRDVFGYEIDVYIPSIKLAIEFDGYYWHKNKYAEDAKKTKYLIDNNIKVVRIRESLLEKITNDDIKVKLNTTHFEIVKLLFNQLGLNFSNFNNEYLYNERIGYLLGKSKNPMKEEVQLAWDTEKNYPIKADQIDRLCNKKYWFFCTVCKKSILKRVFHADKSLYCKSCSMKSRHKNEIDTGLR